MGDYTYTISVDAESKLVLLVLKGEVNKTQGQQVVIETRAKAAETGFDILCDISEAQIIARPADWYFLFRNKEIYPSKPKEKTAILISPEMSKMYKFVGNVTRNLGMQIQIYSDQDAALTWLKNEQ